ncbi:hypothetical protein [Sandaracinus amylolyticus]|uniref:hypothetical protein n=1 Tax=Sandaracinus amylolyticus TaxID=927083 RepID=UPI001F490AA0|nr:hypothetical protein [Sandaracinus amylolyticus]UJR84547.1 Hypothetical protein I5071_66260 [Sandaracinus amylolyticus]
MVRRRWIAELVSMVALACGTSVIAVPLHAAPPPRTFLLRVHVPPSTVDDGFVDARVEFANALFAPASVRFVVDERVALHPARASVRSALDVVQLAEIVDGSRIDVLVVRDLHVGDDAVGFCVPRVGPLDPFVLITEHAGEETLAHELGHYFGNAHSSTPGNVMWPYVGRGFGAHFFDGSQLAIIDARARRFAADGRPATR